MSQSPFDPKALGNRAVIQFSSIANAKPQVAPAPVNNDRAEVERQIAIAKHHANLEIEKYRKLVEDFCSGVDELALFENTGDVIREIAIHFMLESTIEPILKGNLPYGYPEDVYRRVRTDMYRNLIDRYAKPSEG